MSLNALKSWLEIVSAFSALIVGLVAALWAYIKFVVERGLLPPTSFEIECNEVGRQKTRTLLEVVLHLKNLGTSTLIAEDIRVDVRYMVADDELRLADDRRRLGRVVFEGSIRRDLLESAPPAAAPSSVAAESTSPPRWPAVVRRLAGRRDPAEKSKP